MTTRNCVTCGVAAVVLAMGGCLSRGNNRAVVGVDEPGRGAVVPDIAAVHFRSEEPLKSDGPSVKGLSRSGWSTSRVVVPVDGTHAFRTYAKEIAWTKQTSRQRGGAITPMSALDEEGDTRTTRYLEIGASPWMALYDVIAFPVRAVQAAPWEEVRHEPRPFRRAPVRVPTSVPEPARGEVLP
jgi:hypothetical protein